MKSDIIFIAFAITGIAFGIVAAINILPDIITAPIVAVCLIVASLKGDG